MFHPKNIHPLVLSLFIGVATFCQAADTIEDDDDLLVIEIEGIEVFSKSIKVIDGMTGKPYTKQHAVVTDFRRDFNDLLLKFHKKLLHDEYRFLKERIESIKPFEQELNNLATFFDLPAFEIKGEQLTRERAIFGRLMKDPFFEIEELVVWDVIELERNDRIVPKSKYAKDIRYNEETSKWERRITTKWDVSFIRPQNNKWFHTNKEQGLNLDTHQGYHFIEVGLPGNVPSSAFQDVKLSYPIFINTGGEGEAYTQYLKNTLVANLYFIYDPFSWVARRNTRFRGGFSRDIQALVKESDLPLSDRKWFDPVFATFLNDVATIKLWGPEEIYDFRMLGVVKKNKHLLGIDLDLLNWHKGEKRSVDYDPSEETQIPRVSFNSTNGGRFIMLDAYRRYGDKFLNALQTRLTNIKGEAEGSELILQAIEEASGAPRDVYLREAKKAQEAELSKYLR